MSHTSSIISSLQRYNYDAMSRTAAIILGIIHIHCSSPPSF